MKRFLLAFQFLTIIPVKMLDNVSNRDMGRSSAFFPLVGAVQGVILAFSSVLFMKVFPIELTNGLLVLILVITTAGLHLDGLADTFDAIASREDKNKKLAIMKDSMVGPFGVIAIVLVILLKYLLLTALFFNSPLVTYYSSLFLMPVFSRWAMVVAIFHTKSARQDGLGKIFIEHTGKNELLIATLLVLILFASAFIISNKTLLPPFQLSAFIPALPVLYTFSMIVVWFSKKNFGGMTGDTFGAVAEMSELFFLMTVIICLQRYI
jgi:adenosylcobinamide-GDP ribazoletransferase